MSEHVRLNYDGREVELLGLGDNDHIFRILVRSKQFYEIDVLEAIRKRLKAACRTGFGIDAGAFIGTHTVYFSNFCGLSGVMAFEANPETYKVLVQNVDRNCRRGAVSAVNKAVGAKLGHASMISETHGNKGTATFDLDSAQQDGVVEVTTVDDAWSHRIHAGDEVSLIKIDVEGGELDVVRDARGVINGCHPLLCIEVHTAANLAALLRLLREGKYWIVDCRGHSPTYLLERSRAGRLRRAIVNLLWVVDAGLKNSALKWYCRRVAGIFRFESVPTA